MGFNWAGLFSAQLKRVNGHRSTREPHRKEEKHSLSEVSGIFLCFFFVLFVFVFCQILSLSYTFFFSTYKSLYFERYASVPMVIFRTNRPPMVERAKYASVREIRHLRGRWHTKERELTYLRGKWGTTRSLGRNYVILISQKTSLGRTEFTSLIAKSTSPGLSYTTFYARWTAQIHVLSVGNRAKKGVKA